MKILHVPYTYYPDPIGGTEVYVESLAMAQVRAGDEPVVAAPAQADDSGDAVHGVRVHRVRVQPAASIQSLWGAGDRRAADGFARVLDLERPNVLHLHAFTSAVSVLVVREARARGIPTVLTYHTPTVSCPRGTLLRWGKTVCDGALWERRCTACILESKGIPRAAAVALASVPISCAGPVAVLAPQRLAKALRMRSLVSQRARAVEELLSSVDRVVAHARWSADLLQTLAVSSSRTAIVLQALPPGLVRLDSPMQAPPPLRLLYLGRLSPEKGVDVLIKALARRPNLDVRLTIVGAAPACDSGFGREVAKMVGRDKRIHLRSAVSRTDVGAVIADHHALVLPSRWLETGPLVALEAFAIGLPVVGSDLGGIAEVVRHGVDGLLVPPDDPESLAVAISSLIDAGTWETLRREVRSSGRTFDDVALELRRIYQDIIRLMDSAPE